MLLLEARTCLSQIAHEHVGVGDAARARQGGQRERGGAGQQPCRRGAAQAAAQPVGSVGRARTAAPQLARHGTGRAETAQRMPAGRRRPAYGTPSWLRRSAPGLAVGSGFAAGRCAPARRERRERAVGSALRVGHCHGPGARTRSAGGAHFFRLPRSHGARRGVLPAERRPEHGGAGAVLRTRSRRTRATHPSQCVRTTPSERTQRPAGPGAGCRRSR